MDTLELGRKRADWSLIKLSSGSDAVVDSEDFDFLSRFNWQEAKSQRGSTSYAITSVHIRGKRIAISMHRLIMRLSKFEVDHLNGLGLDNRKANLRYATRSENMINFVRTNKTGFRGVEPTDSGKFNARITIDSKRKSLGMFDTAVEAANAYDAAAIELHGHFAVLNFPSIPEPIRPIAQESEERKLLRDWISSKLTIVELVERTRSLLGERP